MDWLSPHHAEIMCFEKAVRLRLPNRDALIIYGDKPSPSLRIVTSMKAQKYLQKKYCAFLAHIIDARKEAQEIKDFPVVRDFPDVFPEDLPGIPPPRQVEFRIDLIPGATPVAKAPYRLAPAEMQELSSQLNELLSKGFIRPSFSPWGAPILFVKKKDGLFLRFQARYLPADPERRIQLQSEGFLWLFLIYMPVSKCSSPGHKR